MPPSANKHPAHILGDLSQTKAYLGKMCFDKKTQHYTLAHYPVIFPSEHGDREVSLRSLPGASGEGSLAGAH